MAMEYTLQGETTNEMFSIETIPAEEFIKSDVAIEDFWRLFQELVADEVTYRSQYGKVLNGEYKKEDIVEYAKGWSAVFFIKNVEGVRVGCGTATDDQNFNTIHIGDIVITKAYRCRGLGKKLVAHMLQSYPGKPFTLNVSAYNPRAVQLYQSLGFGISDYSMFRHA